MQDRRSLPGLVATRQPGPAMSHGQNPMSVDHLTDRHRIA
ncbi:hypothetical protein USDA257_c34420 [Sinorhizobium fredii USDA 257]|uniref:Uncharacterized protein n=1 Tax=Sinorhizobium fredii (strain USDA 257) TaxID=1185652 RepID=I3X7Z5_SINF2|nr:hypothetical protein USDA257_c34420 [Sinorhizobium fredii USDA 257]